jgi:hypothetical protein
MKSNFYKILLVTFLLIVGFFIFAKADVVFASKYDVNSGTCIPACGDGEICTGDGCMPSTGGSFGLPIGGDRGSSGLPVDGIDRAGGTTGLNIGLGSGSGGGTVELPNFVGVKTISELISKIAGFLIKLAMVLAVLALIWAGFQFVTAQGNEEAIKKAKRNLVWTIAGIFVILASQIIIEFVKEMLGGSGSMLTTFMQKIRGTLNNIIGLLFVIVTVYFVWGVVQYVRSGGDEKMLAQGKRHMIWGIIGMAVMASSWGIVSIIANYLGN